MESAKYNCIFLGPQHIRVYIVFVEIDYMVPLATHCLQMKLLPSNKQKNSKDRARQQRSVKSKLCVLGKWCKHYATDMWFSDSATVFYGL